MRDVLTNRDVDEIAQVEPGRVQGGGDSTDSEASHSHSSHSQASQASTSSASHLRIASVKTDGKVSFEDTDNFESFTGKKAASTA